MNAPLSILVNEQQLGEVQQLLASFPGGAVRVFSRALNRVATTTRAEIIREVCEEINLRPSQVRDRDVSLTRATAGTLAARVRVSGRRVPLKSFDAHDLRASRRGVSYAIRKGGRVVLSHAFMATVPSGHRAVLKRRGDRRLPIVELRGPSVPAVVEGLDDFTQEAVDARIGANLEREIDAQLGLALEGRGGFGSGE